MGFSVTVNVSEAPSVSNGIDLLRNRQPERSLGTFDGRVAAHIIYQGQPCFITTNSFFVPAPPNHELTPGRSLSLQLRKDMRWGADDPFSWPQQFVEKYPHLACIARPPRTEHGLSERGIIWWVPAPEDVVFPASHATLTHTLGKLSSSRLHSLQAAVQQITSDTSVYTKSLPLAQQLPLFAQLSTQIQAVVERLACLPLPFERILLEVRSVQQLWLEMDALLRYMLVFRGRMLDSSLQGEAPGHFVGAFTDNPKFAQRLHRAAIPFWLIRPLAAFDAENILKVVHLRWPAEELELEPAAGFSPIPCSQNLVERIWAHHYGRVSRSWYANPLLAVPSTTSTSTRVSSTAPNKPKATRPYPKVAKNTGRDKFSHFDSPWMASSIPTWAQALRQVDQASPSRDGAHPINLYVCPEPALLVSTLDDHRRQLFLHHYQLLRDGLFYWMAHPTDGILGHARSPQEWRDVLQGKIVASGAGETKAQKRTLTIEEVLRPALEASGMKDLSGFPVPADEVRYTTPERARELTWELAEMNFRFELMALDARVSGLERVDCSSACFVGQPISPELSESKLGFSAGTASDRLPYFLRLAELIRDWSSADRDFLRWFEGQTIWDEKNMPKLESWVAKIYTQTFYDYFGRAAVVPLRIDHDVQ
uniref:Uncharacterized protein n=1 Tax=Mycena chlorophos TaxID=658473 RepID=A0ABQ0L2U6_MYCCL|nr:predicted protein [Mycena chlorophos]